MIRAALDWFLWGTGVFFWTVALGGLAGSAVAHLMARRKERAR